MQIFSACMINNFQFYYSARHHWDCCRAPQPPEEKGSSHPSERGGPWGWGTQSGPWQLERWGPMAGRERTTRRKEQRHFGREATKGVPWKVLQLPCWCGRVAGQNDHSPVKDTSYPRTLDLKGPLLPPKVEMVVHMQYCDVTWTQQILHPLQICAMSSKTRVWESFC